MNSRNVALLLGVLAAVAVIGSIGATPAWADGYYRGSGYYSHGYSYTNWGYSRHYVRYVPPCRPAPCYVPPPCYRPPVVVVPAPCYPPPRPVYYERPRSSSFGFSFGFSHRDRSCDRPAYRHHSRPYMAFDRRNCR